MTTPDHYRYLNPQPLDVLQNWGGVLHIEGFLIGNILKYIGRYALKLTPVMDLDKAIHYAKVLHETYGEHGSVTEHEPSLNLLNPDQRLGYHRGVVLHELGLLLEEVRDMELDASASAATVIYSLQQMRDILRVKEENGE
jgi:hypothetical protein